MVDARDVAAVAAEIAATPGAHDGRTYWLTGAALISYADVAAVLSSSWAAGPLPAGQFGGGSGHYGPGRAARPVAAMNAQAFSLIATETPPGSARTWLPCWAARPLFAQFAADFPTVFGCFWYMKLNHLTP